MTRLRFLADESCDFGVVRALREKGFDVLAVSEYTIRSDDRALIRQATQENRILLTEDKDFGWLVFVSREDSAGVILARYPGHARKDLVRDVIRLVESQGEALPGSFVVLQPGIVRIRHGPAE